MELFKRLHDFWVSDENPQQDSCAKLFLGLESHASAGIMSGFVPTGVMVTHKVLLTTESTQDVADAALTCNVRPDQGTTTSIFVCESDMNEESVFKGHTRTLWNHASCVRWVNLYVARKPTKLGFHH